MPNFEDGLMTKVLVEKFNLPRDKAEKITEESRIIVAKAKSQADALWVGLSNFDSLVVLSDVFFVFDKRQNNQSYKDFLILEMYENGSFAVHEEWVSKSSQRKYIDVRINKSSWSFTFDIGL